jgi:hypothetical protein
MLAFGGMLLGEVSFQGAPRRPGFILNAQGVNTGSLD